jgi:hypothetical protein
MIRSYKVTAVFHIEIPLGFGFLLIGVLVLLAEGEEGIAIKGIRLC